MFSTLYNVIVYWGFFSWKILYIWQSNFLNKFTRQQHSLEDVTNLEEEKREWENATRPEYKLCFTKAVYMKKEAKVESKRK